MRIIVGLGNPGEKYKITRHNVGFLIIDELVRQHNLEWQENKKFNALVCKDNNTIFIKPQTFMNNSGQAVQAIMSYYKLLPKTLGLVKQKNSNLTNTLTVIHDDIDIDLGKYKIVEDSRSAGHNGVQSIINHTKTKNFKRIRIGVRVESLKHIPAPNFVLQRFNNEEMEIIKKITNEIIENI